MDSESEMSKRIAHVVGGSLLLIFVIMHMGNHLWGVAFGPAAHEAARLALRKIYAAPLIEPILALAIAMQCVSGVLLALRAGIWRAKGIRRAQIWAGLVLVGFLTVHLSAVGVARLSGVSTDIGFASAGVQDGVWALFGAVNHGWNDALATKFIRRRSSVNFALFS